MITFSANNSILNHLDKLYRMNLHPTSDVGREWLSEMVINATLGRVTDDVNVDAYGYACDRNTQLAKANKEVALLTSDDLEDNKKGVADTVASYIDTNIDAIIESADVVAFVQEFLEMREYVLLEEGLDIWKLLKLAKHNSNTRGIAKIRMLIENYSIGEMLTELLTSKDYMKILGGVIQTC